MILTEKIFEKIEKRKKEAQPMKTEELCNECTYGFHNNHCSVDRCRECEMHPHTNCRCLTIQYGDPCPYFKKFEERESDA